MSSVNAELDMELDSLIEFCFACLAYQGESIERIIEIGSVYELCALFVIFTSEHFLTPLLADDNAHGAAGAGYHAHCRFDIRAVEVFHLLLGYLAYIFFGDRSDLVSLGDTGSRLNTAGLLDEKSRGGSLGDKRETVVCIDRDDDRDHHSHIALGALIEILCELPDIDAVLAECRAYRGSRGCLTGRNLESDVSYNFLCQFSAPLSFNL